MKKYKNAIYSIKISIRNSKTEETRQFDNHGLNSECNKIKHFKFGKNEKTCFTGYQIALSNGIPS